MNDQAKALLLMFGVGLGLGGVSGRATAPKPAAPPEVVRYVPIPAPAVLAPMVEAPDAPVAMVEPPAPPPVVETKPLPPPVEMKRPKVEAKPQHKPAPARPRPVRKPTAAECAQLKLGMLTIGKNAVIEKAKARGYTKAQVDWALAACGI